MSTASDNENDTILFDAIDLNGEKLSLLHRNEQPSAKRTQHRKRSPYLASSILFTLSSVVYLASAVQVCMKNGYTSENIQSLIAAALYVVAYLSYVYAEWNTVVVSDATSSSSSIIPALASMQRM